MHDQLIFITGQVRDAGISQLTDFEIGKQKLADLGFQNVTTAIDGLPVGDDLNSPDAKRFWLLKRKANCEAAHIILTLRSFTEDELSITEARIARQENKMKMGIGEFIIKYTHVNTALPTTG